MKYWKKHLKAIAILLIALLSVGVISVACAQTTQQSKLALDMVLVVDESGSMSAAVNNMHDRYGYRHDAAASLIGLCDAEKSRVALLPFSTNVITTIDGVNELKEIDITSHNDTRRKMLKLLENDATDYSTLYGYSRKYGGETDLGSALERAVEILVENKSDNHPVIVLLSDGEIEISDSNGGKFTPNRQKIAASEKKYNDAIQTAKENGITIYTVALTIKSKLLRNAADSTDGLYHEISNSEDLPAVFNNIFAHLVGSDVVTLSSENVETGENSYRTKFTIGNESELAHKLLNFLIAHNTSSEVLLSPRAYLETLGNGTNLSRNQIDAYTTDLKQLMQRHMAIVQQGLLQNTTEAKAELEVQRQLWEKAEGSALRINTEQMTALLPDLERMIPEWYFSSTQSFEEELYKAILERAISLPKRAGRLLPEDYNTLESAYDNCLCRSYYDESDVNCPLTVLASYDSKDVTKWESRVLDNAIGEQSTGDRATPCDYKTAVDRLIRLRLERNQETADKWLKLLKKTNMNQDEILGYYMRKTGKEELPQIDPSCELKLHTDIVEIINSMKYYAKASENVNLNQQEQFAKALGIDAADAVRQADPVWQQYFLQRKTTEFCDTVRREHYSVNQILDIAEDSKGQLNELENLRSGIMNNEGAEEVIRDSEKEIEKIGSSTNNLKGTGPISHGSTAFWEWERFVYSNDLNTMRIDSISVDYMDGTSEELNKDRIVWRVCGKMEL